jgi:hypothetical protein
MLLCHGFSFCSTENRPYVTCQLSGQLGNQLFEIAATLAYAWDNGVDPIFPELNRLDHDIPLNKEKIFYKLDASPLPRPILNTFSQYINFRKFDIPYQPDLNLVGFFQSWKFFHHHRKKVLDTFILKKEDDTALRLKFADLLKHSCTVGIHVRTFNEYWHSVIPFVGLDYYKKAMEQYPKNALFVVFSDRINWCKHHFKKFKRRMIFIDGQSHIEDLFLMSMMKHNIICNSTFSWWAAYLNRNPKKIVVAPYYFIRSHFIGDSKPPHANLPEWITLKNIDLSAPYPKDIDKYDENTKSLDEKR